MNNTRSINFKVAGGLGNQLFMLCAGLYFQQSKRRTVTFDITDLDRIFLLHPGHNIFTLGLLSGTQIDNVNGNLEKSKSLSTTVKMILRKLHQILGIGRANKVIFVKEVGYFDLTKITQRTKSIFGYFQSWRYYESLTTKPDLSRNILPKPSNWFLEMEEILNRKAIAAFHIRRGDYTLPINRSTGILSIEYFEAISQLIPEDIELWIFTDSPNLVIDKVNKFPQKTFVIDPPADSDPFESLLLMTKASYLAISNSTFSWWAATLAKSEAQIYAPSKWFEQRRDPFDLIPNKWMRIDSKWENQK